MHKTLSGSLAGTVWRVAPGIGRIERRFSPLKRRRAGPHRFVGNFLPGQEGTAFRIEYAGALYHVMARSDRHEATFKDEEAREILSRNVPWDSLLPMDQLEPTRKSETTRLYSLKRLNARL